MRYVLSKPQLTSTGLHGVIFHKAELLIATAERTSDTNSINTLIVDLQQAILYVAIQLLSTTE
jgi:hypothetical protein